MNDSRDIIKLFDEHKNMVYRLALSYLKNIHDAEDAVQIVFLKLIDDKASIVYGKERALLTQITINYCKDVLRSFWRRNKEDLSINIPYEDNADNELFNLVMSLSAKYRVVVYLHYYEGYTFSEIAEFIRISTSAVSMRLHRAREILKKEFGGNFDEI